MMILMMPLPARRERFVRGQVQARPCLTTEDLLQMYSWKFT